MFIATEESLIVAVRSCDGWVTASCTARQPQTQRHGAISATPASPARARRLSMDTEDAVSHRIVFDCRAAARSRCAARRPMRPTTIAGWFVAGVRVPRFDAVLTG